MRLAMRAADGPADLGLILAEEGNMPSDDFEGYRNGDITYCVNPASGRFFPVRVVKIGRTFADVESLRSAFAAEIAPEFDSEKNNRRFVRPELSPGARFGAVDERTVNTGRSSGPELRLLPFHYATFTGNKIKELHRQNPELWPLPTGIVYERWFRDADL